MGASTIIKQEAWEAKAVELFGEDKKNWEFVCPACGNISSINIAKEKYQELKGTTWRPHQECVGRYSGYFEKVKCDWCSYGLFRGPLFVVLKDAEAEEGDYDNENVIPVFDFNGKPFTKPGGDA